MRHCKGCDKDKSNTKFYDKQSKCIDCVIKRAGEYYYLNRERILSRRDVNKERENYVVRIETLEGTISYLYSSTKSRSKQRGYEFDLTKQWIREKLVPLICEVTGLKLELKIDKNYLQSPFRPSLDRIDNTKGYTKENCRMVCYILIKQSLIIQIKMYLEWPKD